MGCPMPPDAPITHTFCEDADEDEKERAAVAAVLRIARENIFLFVCLWVCTFVVVEVVAPVDSRQKSKSWRRLV